MDDDNKLIPEGYSVLEQIKTQEMILATGHISPTVTLALLRAASEIGICKLIATHVSLPLTKADLNLQKEYLACGAMLEHCFYTPYYGLCAWDVILASIQQAGASRTLLSTDFRQTKSPDPVDGMNQFAEELFESGISAEDICRMMVKNPKELLEV